MTCSAPQRNGLFPSLAHKIEAVFVRHRKSLAYIHLGMFLGFMALLSLPLLLADPPEHAGPFEHFTVFARHAIWTVWFPLVFLSVIFTGRSWCGILCPMGAVSEWANRLGLKGRVPRWVRWEGTPIVSFLIVTIWGQLVGVRDHPEAIALVFGTTLAAALVIGFLFGYYKRVWCRHLCPIGLMLGVFSRIGMVQFAPKRPLAGPDRWTEKTACPTMISLPHKKESRHCIECFRCVSPQAKGGLYLRLRKPGEEIEHIATHNPNLAEVLFICLGTGISLGGFLWSVLPSFQHLRQWLGVRFLDWHMEFMLQPGAWWLVSVHPARREVFLWLDFVTITGYMLFWMLGIATLMLATIGLITWITRRQGQGNFGQRFTEIGYFLTPVAMVSLLIGLGGELFAYMGHHLIGTTGSKVVKALLLGVSVVWSVWLCHQILARQNVNNGRFGLLIAAIGSVLVAMAWWPAVVGW